MDEGLTLREGFRVSPWLTGWGIYVWQDDRCLGALTMEQVVEALALDLREE